MSNSNHLPIPDFLNELKDPRGVLHLIIDNIPLFIFWKDLDSVYQGCNQNSATVAGLSSPEEIIGKTDYDLPWKREEAEFFRMCDRRVMDSAVGEYHIVEPQLQASGKKAWLDTNKIPLIDKEGHVIGILGTYEDITERVEQQEKLKHTNEVLERANEELIKANLMINQFLATVSHEIRTPLNGIIGMASIMAFTQLSEEQEEYLRIINSSGDQLLAVINDILDLSKIEAGKIDLEDRRFDLHQAVTDTIDLFGPKALEKELALSYQFSSVPQYVSGDVMRFRQILSNLVSNAIKFTHTGEVDVTISAQDMESERIVVRVAIQDTGIGIAPEKLHLLFKPFSQVDSSTSRQYGGTGLGLTISKRLAVLMGGDIDVMSTPGMGSVFTLTIVFRHLA